jgi:excisionase family DNA binding protein
MTTQTLLTVGEVAAELRLSRRTVQRLIEAGDLAAVNVSTSTTAKTTRNRVRRADLDLFLETRKAVA